MDQAQYQKAQSRSETNYEEVVIHAQDWLDRYGYIPAVGTQQYSNGEVLPTIMGMLLDAQVVVCGDSSQEEWEQYHAEGRQRFPATLWWNLDAVRMLWNYRDNPLFFFKVRAE